MPYSPYRKGPAGAAVAFLVAIIAVIIGVLSLQRGHDARATVMLLGAIAAAGFGIYALT